MSTKPRERKIYKPNLGEYAQPPSEMMQSAPLVFVAESMTAQIGKWRSWLRSQSPPSIEDLALRTTRFGKVGWLLPSYWPEDRPHSSRFALFLLIAAKSIGHASQASDERSDNPGGQFGLDSKRPYFSARSRDCRARPKLLADD
jgi:hypothetical protein